jgi:cytochrome b561
MQLRNSSSRYGLVSIVLHWGIALAVFGLFGLGLWMVTLDYDSPYNHSAPALHKSIGLTLLALMIARLVWRFISPPPPTLATYSPATRLGAKLGHAVLYLGLFAVMIAGYLISTADGRPIEVFGLFAVPASLTSIPDQEDVAGAVHLYLAWGLVIFAGLHALAALKHHFIDHDVTLTRMLGRRAS